ncbi:hypothetical protein Q6A51_11755 [Pseudomonas sp. KFB-139]|uniref:Lipoprotein n=1 Tax=Pseudomonas serbiensis TaxID=3064350 RepID=A0ABT9CPY9_9PSED|nr:hypothetical protein [Pseudomonas sp. KFB-138]MDO7927460.1 hypothetical protein [Pseudomonas sp. KFB-138]
MKFNSATLFLALVLAGCDEEPQPAQMPASEDALAQYQTIRIGNERLSLPTIALLSSTTNSNLILNDGTEVPAKKVLSHSTHGTYVSLIQLDLDAYSQLQDFALDTHAYVSRAFCEKLLTHWERSQCKTGLYDGKHVFSPHTFSVVERSYLIDSKEQLFAFAGKGPTGGDAARKMIAEGSGSQITCVPTQQPLCTALMPIRDDLLVVWATRQESVEEDRKNVRWIVEKYLGK